MRSVVMVAGLLALLAMGCHLLDSSRSDGNEPARPEAEEYVRIEVPVITASDLTNLEGE